MNTRYLKNDDDSSTLLCRAPVRAALAALMTALIATPALAVADDDSEAKASSGRVCSATATLLHSACGLDAIEEHQVAKAKCLHIGNAGARTTCGSDAKQERDDAVKLCSAQLSARRAACVTVGEARYDPPFEPDLFDRDFRQLSNPNPYYPLAIGNQWQFRGGDERSVVTVTSATKLIDGVTCVVVRDLVYESGRLAEATDDWFAAGRDGSTWYCGEESKDYENFKGDQPRRPELVSNDGSFKHGRDHDKAGIIMPARPKVGQVYAEEFSLANAEDYAEILSVNYSYGSSPTLDKRVPRELAQRLCQNDCVVTKNYSPIEPGQYELKYYARGIGFFLETKPGEADVLQLVDCNFDQRCVALPAP